VNWNFWSKWIYLSISVWLILWKTWRKNGHFCYFQTKIAITMTKSGITSIFKKLNWLSIYLQGFYLHHSYKISSSNSRVQNSIIYKINLTVTEHRTYICKYSSSFIHFNHEAGGGMFLRNLGIHLQDYIVSQPTRPQFVFTVRQMCTYA
jgi:hypothetical protein